MQKKKILILGKLPPPFFGPAIATQILLNSRLRDSYELIHFNTGLNASIAEMGNLRLSKIWKSFGLYFCLLKKTISQRPSVVLIPISQTTMGFFKDSPYIWIALFCRSKIILHLRGSNFRNWMNSSSSITRFYVKNMIKLSHGMIVLGNNLRYLFQDILTKNRIFVVPNGANYELEAKKKNNDRTKILYLGNLLRSKGIEDLLDAVHLLKKMSIPNLFHVDVVGAWDDDDLKKKCVQDVSKYNLPVRFHSPMSGKKKFSFLTDADLFIFVPRDPEGHPWVIVEALASGLPIIATNQGAIVESVFDKENGYIVDPKNPKQIAEKIKLLLNNPVLMESMGEKSRQIYLKKFTEEKMVENLSNVFEEVLAK